MRSSNSKHCLQIKTDDGQNQKINSPNQKEIHTITVWELQLIFIRPLFWVESLAGRLLLNWHTAGVDLHDFLMSHRIIVLPTQLFVWILHSVLAGKRKELSLESQISWIFMFTFTNVLSTYVFKYSICPVQYIVEVASLWLANY